MAQAAGFRVPTWEPEIAFPASGPALASTGLWKVKPPEGKLLFFPLSSLTNIKASVTDIYNTNPQTSRGARL